MNYQIEHHLWPDLPPSAYQRVQPKVKAVCEKHGVPYVQEPLHRRLAQLLGIVTGEKRMQASRTQGKHERRGAASPVAAAGA